MGGASPFGYLVDRALDNIVPEPVERGTVNLIFNLYTKDRLGTSAIANDLNERGLRTRLGRPWSPHTVEIIITNRLYIGEKSFRDVTVPNAHEALISEKQFDLAQRILGKRSAEIGRRAANPSEYTLTGKIRCPECGRGYIGTAATGRTRQYRYYTCWSRVRYGTKAGCGNHRINADEIETAIGSALRDFYANHTDLITRATAEFQAAHDSSSSQLRDELTAVRRELKDTSAAVDRYLIAFERGTIDDEDPDIRKRLATLRDQSKTLRSRKAQLEFELDQPPRTLSSADLRGIHHHITMIMKDGDHRARKALFEALIDEITITTDSSVTPVYRLPLDTEDDKEPILQGPAQADYLHELTVRAPTTMVVPRRPAFDLPCPTGVIALPSGRDGAYRRRMRSRLLAATFEAPDPARPARFWADLLGREAIEDAFGVLLPGEDTQLGLRFVPGRAGQLGADRMHLHLTSADLDDQQHVVATARKLGARHLDVGQRPEEGHIVLADPAGYAFCVIEPHNAYLAGCGFLGELACDGTRAVGLFWSRVLGWPLVWDQNEETAIQSPRGGTKVAWGGPPVAPKQEPNRQRFELIPAAGDQPAAVDELMSLGAARLDTAADGTVVLADPDGNEFWLRGTGPDPTGSPTGSD